MKKNNFIEFIDNYDLDESERLLLISAVMELKMIILYDPGMVTNRMKELDKELNIGTCFKKPKFGRFDPYQPIITQIKMTEEDWDSFEVIQILKDIPNKENDSKVANLVLNPPNKKYDIKKLKQHIEKAKQINSVLNEEAKKFLVDFYVALRNPEIYDDHSLKPIPLSPKQIKTMKSLTEGFAKLRLSSEAIKEDAENTLRIMKSLLRQYGYDAEENKIKVVSRNENE